MKATETKLLDFLKKSPQLSIPIYQRTYSWTESQCQQIWDDILRTGKKDEISPHFIGSIVYIEKGHYQVSSQQPLLVIDGQQRITTLSLIIEALARHLENQKGKDYEPIDGFSTEKLRSYYLLNTLEKDERRYKLLLTQTDKETLLSIMNQKPLPDNQSLRLKENFDFFEKKIKELGDQIIPLCKGLTKLLLVDISLNRDQDNPQLIFESMNSTGLDLSQADLIRNFILMGLEPEHQTRLHKDYWRPMEVSFGQEAYGTHFDSFMRHYLTLKTGEIPKIKQVYEAFKLHARKQQDKKIKIDDLVADLRAFADYYCSMALGQETCPLLDSAFHDLRELNVDVAYPFLLELYQDYSNNILPADDMENAVRLIESYVFRRAICSIPTNSLNKTFSTFGRYLSKDNYMESILAHFLLLPSYRRFPDDDEFCREITMRDLYNFRSRSYWLRKLENDGRKERVFHDEYTIEHIMPQNENLSRQWRDALGNDWQHIHKTLLHTLGNLTLTGYNTEYSDRPFSEKRDMKGGFKESPLRVNEGLKELDVWNETTIKNRASHLAKKAVKVWKSPTLSDEVLNTYRHKEEKPEKYTIENHSHLDKKSLMHPVFERFRKEVLAFDPCVSEEFLKLYVAYKAESNFVDVIPQAKQLRLSLNLQFHELHDPKKLSKNVTNLNRCGNGDIEVILKSLEQLPYVLGLVRQAFEKQIGNEETKT